MRITKNNNVSRETLNKEKEESEERENGIEWF